MADPGTILGAVSITFQAFAGCVKAFIVLKDAKSHGKNITFLRTMLNFEENRFVIWCDKVGLLSKPPNVDPRINWTIASELLKQLEHVMSTSNLKHRYKLELQTSTETVNVQGISDSAQAEAAQGILSAIMTDDDKRDILLRANLLDHANSWPKKLWWAMVDKQQFEKMVQDVRDIVNRLWVLLSDAQQDDSQSTLRQVLANSIQVSRNLEELMAWKATVEATPHHSAAQTLISAAASLRSAMLQIEDVSKGDNESLTNEVEMIKPLTIDDKLRAKAIFQPSLSPAKLKQLIAHQYRSQPSDQSIAIYDGKAVFVETKHVTAKMKGPLRKRVEDIVTMLARQQPADFCILRALGFIEDSSGYQIIFEHPNAPVSAHPSLQSGLEPPSLPHTLLELFDIVKRPPLELRMHLAVKICRTILTFHVAGWLHKGLRSSNILFFSISGDSDFKGFLHRPYLAGFNFSRPDNEYEISEDIAGTLQTDIYRHPDCVGEPTTRFARYMDLYGLATLLIEIGEWYPLRKLVATVCDISKSSSKEGTASTLSVVGPIQPYLLKTFITKGNTAFRMGSTYGHLVELCLRAKEDQMSDAQSLQMFHKVLIQLENGVKMKPC